MQLVKENDRLIVPITHILLAMLLMLLALAVLAQANPGTRIPGRDYDFYVYIGDQIIPGKLSYLEAELGESCLSFAPNLAQSLNFPHRHKTTRLRHLEFRPSTRPLPSDFDRLAVYIIARC
jgi:hypothetical protein